MQGSIDPPQQEMQRLQGLLSQGKFAALLEQSTALIAQHPQSVFLRNIAGVANGKLARWPEALARFDEANALNAGYALVHFNRGNALYELKRFDEAVASYDRAIEILPKYGDAYINRGNALQDLKLFDAAVENYDNALKLNPNSPNAHYNRGVALHELKRLDEALACFNKAIQLTPGYANAYNNRGNALQDLRRLDEAVASYDRALQLAPNYADAHSNRGIALRALGRLDEALASFDAALQISPTNHEIYYNRGAALQELKRLDEAIASFDWAIRLKPDYALAISESINQRAHICDWAETSYALDLATLGIEGEAIPPFSLLAAEDNPKSHLERARNWARKNYAGAPAVLFTLGAKSEKLRIGYFSADFHNHATMYVLANMFECHDKSRFEIHAFSYDVAAEDEMRRRLLGAVDAFHDVSTLSDQAVAELARAKSIDIAVDLKGYTRFGRPGIFSYGAAPVQANYMGYPGSSGADFSDYLIADRRVIPERAQPFYSEKILYLPDSYFVNDRLRRISDRPFRRAELGLPEDAFVFCCFNLSYKISAHEFDIWMRLLGRVEGSVLWLLRDNPWAEANLRKEAEARGIDSNRLVFADKIELADHLARHRCADLFLDTFNVNAHTTATDALWAGLPVVTEIGESFAARVAGSLLHAIHLPELIAETPEAYEQLALDLATNRERLAALKAKLAANRLTTPLFDTQRFTRHIEHGYQLAYERHANGLPPADIEVPAA